MTQLGVLTKGAVIEVNVSELGLVTTGGKVAWGKYAQVTNNPENDGESKICRDDEAVHPHSCETDPLTSHHSSSRPSRLRQCCPPRQLLINSPLLVLLSSSSSASHPSTSSTLVSHCQPVIYTSRLLLHSWLSQLSVNLVYIP